jgi:cell division transport system permease protein
MELVGATPGFVRLPFLLEGIIQGLIGGILAACILYLLLEHAMRFILVEVAQYVHMNATFYLLVAGSGVALGLVGSVISVARFINTAPRT